MLKYTVSLTIAMAVIWLLFSGKWTHPILLPLGAVSVALTVYLAQRTNIIDREGHPVFLLAGSLKYWPWLLIQITRANLVVARHILSGNQTLNPRITHFTASQKSTVGRVILANSITLTPGTVAIHVRDQEIWFYALTETIARGIAEGEMDRRATAFEGEQ